MTKGTVESDSALMCNARPFNGLLHEEVGWTTVSVVRVLVHRWILIGFRIDQIRGHIVCVEVAMNRMERQIQARAVARAIARVAVVAFV